MNALARRVKRLVGDNPRSNGFGAVGLDFGFEALHMAQFRQSPDGPVLHEYATVPYPSIGRPELLGDVRALRQFLRESMMSSSFSGRRIVCCSLPDHTKLLILHYMVDAGRKEQEVMLHRLADRLDDELDNYVIDYVPIRQQSESSKEAAALVAVAEKQAVVRQLDNLHAAGYSVEALEIGPIAIRRLVSCLSETKHHETVLVVTLARSHSYLTVLSGRRLIFDREVGIGEGTLVDRLCTALDLERQAARRLLYSQGFGVCEVPKLSIEYSQLEVSETVLEILKPLFLNLAADIQKALIYTASETRGKSIGKIYLVGGIAEWAGADRLLAGLLNMPVQVLNPLQGTSGHDGDRSAPGVAVAAGLALREFCTDV